MHLFSKETRRGKGLITVWVLVLLALPLSATSAGADYLLQSARAFPGSYLEPAADFVLEDVNGDAIPDIVLGGTYREGYPIVVTLPGLGNGTFDEPVLTDSPLPRGAIFAMAAGLLDDDQHLDLVLTYDDQQIDFGVIALLGNGDGSFTLSDKLALSHENRAVVTADFTGDGVTDIALTEDSYPDWMVRIFQGAGDGTFSQAGTFALGEFPSKLVAGDFDGDGDHDLASGGWNSDSLTVLLNDGSGAFTSSGYDAPNAVDTLKCGDLDDDGFDDLVAGTFSSSGSVWVYFGSAGGTLSPYVEHDAGENVSSLDLGDLDGDGDLDIAANCTDPEPPWNGKVSVVLNNGNGNFGSPEYSFRHGRLITLGDMDGDSELDAVMNGPGGYATVLLGRGDGSFQAMTDVLEGEATNDVASADLDGDGDMDLGMVGVDDFNESYVGILFNSGNGTFADPVDYDAGDNSRDLLFSDLNGDDHPEMIIRNSGSNVDDGFSVMFNAGDGTFHNLQAHAVGDNVKYMGAGDLDGDGDLDMAVCCWTHLGVLLNPGDGMFTGVNEFDIPSFPRDMDMGDVDGDGDLDLVITGEVDWQEGVGLLANNGDGSFAAPQLISGLTISQVCLVDLDGDGDLDLAVGHYLDSTLRLLINDGTGNFSGGTTEYLCYHEPDLIRAADINQDGHLDIIASNQYYGFITIFPGHGDGTLGKAEFYPVGNGGGSMDIADFDGNGSLDVVESGFYPAELSILFNSWSASGLLVAGPGRGEFNPTLVRVFPAAGSGSYIAQWSAYNVDRYGVNVVLGELTGSGSPEVVTGPGPGAVFGPHVRGFEITGTPLPGVSFLAYGTNKYGVNIACGDLDHDGYDEIITGAGPGAVFGPHVRGWNWDGGGTPTPIPGISYFAYGTPKWGVNVSCGDIDGDGFDEIVTGAGPGAVYGPHVRGWNCDGGGALSIPGVSFLAYRTNKFGVNVCCGDIDGDGFDEMVTGAGPGEVFGPHVRAWNWDGSGTAQPIPGVSFFAYGYTQWGVNVSCGDLDDDGIDEILTGPGPGETHVPRVRGWNYDGQSLTAMGGLDFLAYDQAAVTHGVKVAGNRR